MIIIVLLIAIVLRLININQSLWLDEATSVLVARDFSVQEILTRFSPGDFHPPLYYLMLKGWISLFGLSEIAIRSMSVVFGVVTIWVIYAISHEIFISTDKKLTNFPLLSALLLATASLHIYYSQEARMYVHATFFVSLSVLFFIRVLKNPSVLNWSGLTIATALFLYTDYPPVFMGLVFVLYIVIFARDHFKRYFTRWILSLGLVTALFAPWIFTLFQQLTQGLAVKTNAPGWWETLGRTDIKQLALVPVKFMIGRISVYDKVLYVLAVLAASIPYISVLLRSFQSFVATKMLWMWLLVPIITAAILGLKFSGFSYFRLLYVLPAFYLLAAYGAVSIKNRRLRMGVIGGLLMVNLITSGIYLSNSRFHRGDWRSAVNWIEEHSGGKNASAIFVTRNQRDPYFYYQKSVLAFGPEGLEKKFDTLWLIRYVQPIFDPQDTLSKRIEDMGYEKLDERDFNGVVIWQYENRN